VLAFVQEGSYYSQTDSEGSDAAEVTNSRSYRAHVAARAIVLIEADDPVIGLMAVVPIGMSEVSSCKIDPTLTEGYHLEKGKELGYFQFGGSTECLVFRSGAIASFALRAIPQPHDPEAGPVLVRSHLATASN
jgi:phosphatidylserine decarboxylase